MRHLFLVILLCSLNANELQAQDIATRKTCPQFLLKDYRGQEHALDQVESPFKVIAFLGTECPLAKLYATRLSDLATEFSKDVKVFGIMANHQDSLTEVAAFAKKHGIKFPLLKDPSAGLADQLEAKRTPEVFLLDAENQIRYRGRVDDQYGVGYTRNAPTREDLVIAIQELLAKRDVSISETDAVGCLIGRPSKTSPSGNVAFTKDIAPILQRNCVECHRDGQIAPFSLTNYEEVVGWAETIREVIEDRRMPPWHADPAHGSFSNERSMPDEEKRLLFEWIDNGMPQGDVADLPEPPPSIEGWSLPRKPDLVVPMSEVPFVVPAEGTVEYQYFVVDPKFEDDKWVVAAEVIPGNRSVVHHAIVFVRPPEGERQNGIGWLTAFVPGQSLFSLPAGMARRVPKGSKLVFQLHYTPTGAAANDVTSVGLNFTDSKSVDTEVQTRIVIDRDFEIPPGVADFEVAMATSGFPAGSELMAIAPHMHYRGKAFQVMAETGNSSKILLNVPKYDFNWQHAYVLAERLPLEDVKIACTGVV